jgi:hypothetical protein
VRVPPQLILEPVELRLVEALARALGHPELVEHTGRGPGLTHMCTVCTLAHMRTTINVSDEIFRQVKRLAVERGRRDGSGQARWPGPRDTGVTHDAHLAVVVRPGPVQHAAVVRDDHVAGLPPIGVRPGRSTGEVEELREELLRLRLVEAGNAVGVTADEEGRAAGDRVHLG